MVSDGSKLLNTSGASGRHGDSDVQYLKDGYYLRSLEFQQYKLGVTKERLKSVKSIDYLSFTDRQHVREGDYLFSLEDGKVTTEFNAPFSLSVLELNDKYVNVSDQYADLLKNPEAVNNYLMVVKKSSLS